jgi:hypothetical protein
VRFALVHPLVPVPISSRDMSVAEAWPEMKNARARHELFPFPPESVAHAAHVFGQVQACARRWALERAAPVRHVDGEAQRVEAALRTEEDAADVLGRDARRKGEALVAEKMQAITAGLPLPPGMKLPF